MKKIILLFALIFALTSCLNTEEKAVVETISPEIIETAKQELVIQTVDVAEPVEEIIAEALEQTESTTTKKVEKMKDKVETKVMDDVMKKDEKSVEEKVVVSAWSYTDYSENAFASTSWKKVLFFHATWCPSCNAADKNLKAETIAEWLNVFKLDFDSNTDLRKKYWVVAQHTFVYVDDNMEKIKLMVGGRNSEDIVNGLLK